MGSFLQNLPEFTGKIYKLSPRHHPWADGQRFLSHIQEAGYAIPMGFARPDVPDDKNLKQRTQCQTGEIRRFSSNSHSPRTFQPWELVPNRWIPFEKNHRKHVGEFRENAKGSRESPTNSVDATPRAAYSVPDDNNGL